MRAEKSLRLVFTRTLYVKQTERAWGRPSTLNGAVSPMFVFRLLGAIWRAGAALALGLAIIVSLPGDVLAVDAQVSVTQPSDTMSQRYDPTSVTISAGGTVTWTNTGSTTVTVTSADGLFDYETLAPGTSFSYTFDTPGTFRYFCVPYPHMKGVVVVSP